MLKKKTLFSKKNKAVWNIFEPWLFKCIYFIFYYQCNNTSILIVNHFYFFLWITLFGKSHFRSNIPVPTDIGCPTIIFSDIPLILSCFPWVAASNKKSVVFSNEANIIVESFILSTPFLVNPITLPLQVITSAKRYICLGFTLTPCSFIVSVTWFMMLFLAASMPKFYYISKMWLENVLVASTPGVLRTSERPIPSAKITWLLLLVSLVTSARLIELMPPMGTVTIFLLKLFN